MAEGDSYSLRFSMLSDDVVPPLCLPKRFIPYATAFSSARRSIG
jgi:hypothetical protein